MKIEGYEIDGKLLCSGLYTKDGQLSGILFAWTGGRIAAMSDEVAQNSDQVFAVGQLVTFGSFRLKVLAFALDTWVLELQ